MSKNTHVRPMSDRELTWHVNVRTRKTYVRKLTWHVSGCTCGAYGNKLIWCDNIHMHTCRTKMLNTSSLRCDIHYLCLRTVQGNANPFWRQRTWPQLTSAQTFLPSTYQPFLWQRAGAFDITGVTRVVQVGRFKQRVLLLSCSRRCCRCCCSCERGRSRPRNCARP